MMKRQEQKYLINFQEFSRVLKKFKIFRSYNSRIINSIYFDDENFKNYFDSEEGTVPRKKIRFRFYGNVKKIDFDNKFIGKIEIKETHQNFRLKKGLNTEAKNYYFLKKIVNRIFSKKLKGVCMITYRRHYYENKDIRFTYDENIKYNNLKSLNNYCFDKNIVEAKFKNPNIFELNNLFGDKVVRFSKYSMVISKLYNLNL